MKNAIGFAAAAQGIYRSLLTAGADTLAEKSPVRLPFRRVRNITVFVITVFVA